MLGLTLTIGSSRRRVYTALSPQLLHIAGAQQRLLQVRRAALVIQLVLAARLTNGLLPSFAHAQQASHQAYSRGNSQLGQSKKARNSLCYAGIS